MGQHSNQHTNTTHSTNQSQTTPHHTTHHSQTQAHTRNPQTSTHTQTAAAAAAAAAAGAQTASAATATTQNSHYKYHNDCQSSVLTFEQVQRLDFVMDQIVPIHGRGNFPTLYVKLKELIRMVKHKLQTKHSIEIRDVRLNGGAASYVLAPENSHYNDLDLIFGTDLSDETSFDVMRDVVLECLRDIFHKTAPATTAAKPSEHNYANHSYSIQQTGPATAATTTTTSSSSSSSSQSNNNHAQSNIKTNTNLIASSTSSSASAGAATTQVETTSNCPQLGGQVIENNQQQTVVFSNNNNNLISDQEQAHDSQNDKNRLCLRRNEFSNVKTTTYSQANKSDEIDADTEENRLNGAKLKHQEQLKHTNNDNDSMSSILSSPKPNRRNISGALVGCDNVDSLSSFEQQQQQQHQQQQQQQQQQQLQKSDNLKNFSQNQTVDIITSDKNQFNERMLKDPTQKGFVNSTDNICDGHTSETRFVALETSGYDDNYNFNNKVNNHNDDKAKQTHEDKQQQQQQQHQQQQPHQYQQQKQLSDHSDSDSVQQIQQQQQTHYHYNQMPLSDCAIKEAYVHKMVKVNDDDRWSLISLGVQQSESNGSANNDPSADINSCQASASCQQQAKQVKIQPQFVIQGCSLQRLPNSQHYHPSIAAFSYPNYQRNSQNSSSCASQQKQLPNSIELKFVDRMRRKFEFSVDSFQIILDSLLEFYDYAPQATITSSSLDYARQDPQKDSMSSLPVRSCTGTSSTISSDGNNSNCSSGCCCCEGGCGGGRVDEMIDSGSGGSGVGCCNGVKGICQEENDFMPIEEQNLNHDSNHEQDHHHHHQHHQQQHQHIHQHSHHQHHHLPLEHQMSSTVSSSGCSSSSSVVSSSSSSLSYDDEHEDFYGDADISPSSSVSTSSLLSSTNMSMLSSDSRRGGTKSDRKRAEDGLINYGCSHIAMSAASGKTGRVMLNRNLYDSRNALCKEQSRLSYTVKQKSRLYQVATSASSHLHDGCYADPEQQHQQHRHQQHQHHLHQQQQQQALNRCDGHQSGRGCNYLHCVDLISGDYCCSQCNQSVKGGCGGNKQPEETSFSESEINNSSSCAVISENFYPTVVGRSEYGDFKEALYHLERKLIATRSPEEIRGGGLLKYCNLLVKNYKPTNAYQIRTLERYMCSRFFIDFSDLNQQQAKLESYLANHFSDDPRLKFDYLTILHNIVQRSTVCLMNHELRLTLNMIRDLACKLHEQQLQRRHQQQQQQKQQQQQQQQQQQKQPVPLLLGTSNMVLVSITPHNGMRQPSGNPTAWRCA